MQPIIMYHHEIPNYTQQFPMSCYICSIMKQQTNYMCKAKFCFPAQENLCSDYQQDYCKICEFSWNYGMGMALGFGAVN